MNWLKQNWFKVGLLSILIISIAGAFYWFEWRANQIKKSCYIHAHTKIYRPKTIEDDIVIPFIREEEKINREESFDRLYKLCLQREGL